MNGELEAEVEALRSIFEDELEVERGAPRPILSKKVRPNDEGRSAAASLRVKIEILEGVCGVTIVLREKSQYPEVSPLVKIQEPRGLAEKVVREAEKRVKERLEKNRGMPVLFDVFQVCADMVVEAEELDESTEVEAAIPPCPICLETLRRNETSEEMRVVRTTCEHFVHAACFSAFAAHARSSFREQFERAPIHEQKNLIPVFRCPVCRAELDEGWDEWADNHDEKERRKKKKKAGKQNKETVGRFEFDWSTWRRRQAEMKEILERQRQKGGIIDLEEERKRNLVTEDTVVILPTTEASMAEPTAETSVEETTTTNANAGPNCEEKKPEQQQRSGEGRGRGEFRGRRGRGRQHPQAANREKKEKSNGDVGQKKVDRSRGSGAPRIFTRGPMREAGTVGGRPPGFPEKPATGLLGKPPGFE